MNWSAPAWSTSPAWHDRRRSGGRTRAARTATGKPLLANDPHRAIGVPSLRYVMHLVGPGWNVIGAGEPALPGIAAGHNERVGFGFTIVGMDQQDVYVEEVGPCGADGQRCYRTRLNSSH